MKRLKEYLVKIVDNRGKNPNYKIIAKYPVIDNGLIKNTLYPDLNSVNRYIDEDTYQKFLRGYVHKNMPIMTLVGNGIGNVTLSPSNDVAIVQNTIGFETNEFCNEIYLYYYFINSQEMIKSFDRGSGQPSIKKTDILDMEVDFPNVKIQKLVADFLYKIDWKIELNNKINKNLLEQALTIYNINIKDLNSIGKISDYCDIKSGFAFKSNWWVDSGIPVIKIGTIEQDNLNINNFSYVNNDKVQYANNFIVTGGDVVIAMTGATIGKYCIVPKTNKTLLVNQRVGKFNLGKEPIYKLPFLYCTLKQPEVVYELINRGQGSAQPNMSANDIMSINCIIPSNKVIDMFNYETIGLFKMYINNQYENYLLSLTRNRLLPKLMSGEIDVSKIDI